MEEKVVDGKEKKYVLYTVVGEERGRAGVGVWVVRVLLGTLLLVALAVVPYLSLRLAQVSDRTLVVFQPVPVRNHSLHHHQHHVLEHGKQGHVDVVSILQSAALTRENYTADSTNTTGKAAPAAPAAAPAAPAAPAAETNASTTSSTAGGIVTLHESAVTLAVMEDTNATRKRDNDTDDEDSGESEEDSSEKTTVGEDKKEVEENSTTEDTVGTSEAPASIAQVAAVTVVASPSTPPVVVDNTTAAVTTTPAPRKDGNVTSAAPVPSTAAAHVSTQAASTTQSPTHTTGKVPSTKLVNVSSVPSTLVPNTTTTPTTTTASTSSRRPLAHKLVYVASTASGNHVGGFCVWKTDTTITHWSYFYENIPIEYQSHQDASDHEMRGMLAAVRAWAPLWNDSHVVLRSHHPAIEGADHPTRRALSHELEKLSEGHFTYELEWRLRKTDRVVDISYSLSRLHRDYSHWFRTFQERVDELLGPQDWRIAKKQNREVISQEFFYTDYPEESSSDVPGKK
ncbi:uncharacterized protein [Panulirus ornatus]